MANEIVALQTKLETRGGELRIDSRIVAEGLGVKTHGSWRTNILLKYKSRFEGLGSILEMTLPDGTIIWYLNEAQVNFAGTLSRNSDAALEFKYRLVKAFELAKKLLLQRQNAEWLEARNAGKRARKQETDGIKAFVNYAKAQGSENAERYYANISKMENKALFLVEQKYPNLRDVLGVAELWLISIADKIVLKALSEGIERSMHYKDIYKLAKERVEEFAALHGKVAVPTSAQELPTLSSAERNVIV